MRSFANTTISLRQDFSSFLVDKNQWFEQFWIEGINVSLSLVQGFVLFGDCFLSSSYNVLTGPAEQWFFSLYTWNDFKPLLWPLIRLSRNRVFFVPFYEDYILPFLNKISKYFFVHKQRKKSHTSEKLAVWLKKLLSQEHLNEQNGNLYTATISISPPESILNTITGSSKSPNLKKGYWKRKRYMSIAVYSSQLIL